MRRWAALAGVSLLAAAAAPAQAGRRIPTIAEVEAIAALPETEGMFSFPDLGDATGPYVWMLSLSLFNATRYSLAMTGFQRYEKLAFPKQPRDSLPDEFLWYRGLTAVHMRWFDTATADFQALLARSLKRELADTLIRIPIGTNDVRYVLALVAERSGRPADAVRYYQEAATNDLGLFMAHVRLAQLYRGLGMMTQAADEAQRAVAASPDDPSTLVEYGLILRDADRREEAVAALREAMQRNPHDPRIPFNLGLVLTELGKPAEAREAFARFVAIAPTSYDRQMNDAKQRLATLAH